MDPRMKKRRRGAPKGNQNARKHGFYSQVLDEAQRLDLTAAQDITGIDFEIAVLRVKIKAILEKDPENIELLMDATNTLARLLRTQYNLDKSQGKSVKEAIVKVISELAVPLGIGVGGAIK
ncbi:hypothetical protein ES703_70542 [subsurface metagenome]